MRGVKCSWAEQARIRQRLSAMKKGDATAFAGERCLSRSLVNEWRRCDELVDVLKEEGVQISVLTHFQPSHATEIARHFRKVAKPPWDEGAREQILDWIDRVESNQLTVEALRMELQESNRKDVSKAKSFGLITDLNELVANGQKFSTIYADPPWQYSNSSTRAAVGGDSKSAYKSTMDLDAICAEPVSQLVEDEAHLHLWTTNAFLPHAFRVIEAWGFEYKSCFVWVKPQMGIGNYWRVSHEFMLLGVRGGLRFKSRGEKSWKECDRTKHSRKPREVREAIERVSRAPFLEMYGREPLEQPWTVYGNDVEERLFA